MTKEDFKSFWYRQRPLTCFPEAFKSALDQLSFGAWHEKSLPSAGGGAPCGPPPPIPPNTVLRVLPSLQLAHHSQHSTNTKASCDPCFSLIASNIATRKSGASEPTPPSVAETGSEEAPRSAAHEAPPHVISPSPHHRSARPCRCVQCRGKLVSAAKLYRHRTRKRMRQKDGSTGDQSGELSAATPRAPGSPHRYSGPSHTLKARTDADQLPSKGFSSSVEGRLLLQDHV